MESCKVSVITPFYNSEKTIERTLQSVMKQTRPVDEYIIVDGASKDRTLEIVKSYESKFEGRMRIISEPDDGIYYAMNKGIASATGDLIGIVNSDDYYEEDAVSNILQGRKLHDYQIIYGFERILDEDTRKETCIVRHHHENLLNQMITHPTCFVTKKLYEDKGVFDTKYRYSADYDFMLRMYKDEEVIFTPVDQVISNYALGGASGTGEAYMETMGLMLQYGSITEKQYKFIRFKYKVGKLLRR